MWEKEFELVLEEGAGFCEQGSGLGGASQGLSVLTTSAGIS